jgi:hypothetical protein
LASIKVDFQDRLRSPAAGQTNFVKTLWKFNSVYDPEKQLADHAAAITYEMRLPVAPGRKVNPSTLYIHQGQGKVKRDLDNATAAFVDQTRHDTPQIL